MMDKVPKEDCQLTLVMFCFRSCFSWSFQDGADRWSQNVSKGLPFSAA